MFTELTLVCRELTISYLVVGVCKYYIGPIGPIGDLSFLTATAAAAARVQFALNY